MVEEGKSLATCTLRSRVRDASKNFCLTASSYGTKSNGFSKQDLKFYCDLNRFYEMHCLRGYKYRGLHHLRPFSNSLISELLQMAWSNFFFPGSKQPKKRNRVLILLLWESRPGDAVETYLGTRRDWMYASVTVGQALMNSCSPS